MAGPSGRALTSSCAAAGTHTASLRVVQWPARHQVSQCYLDKPSKTRGQRYWSAWPDNSVWKLWFTCLCVSSAALDPSSDADGNWFLVCTADLREEQAFLSRAQYRCSWLSQTNGLPGHQLTRARSERPLPQPNTVPQGASATARRNAASGANHQPKTPCTRLARSSPATEPKSN